MAHKSFAFSSVTQAKIIMESRDTQVPFSVTSLDFNFVGYFLIMTAAIRAGEYAFANEQS